MPQGTWRWEMGDVGSETTYENDFFYLINNHESSQNLQAKIQILILRILRQVASEPTLYYKRPKGYTPKGKTEKKYYQSTKKETSC